MSIFGFTLENSYFLFPFHKIFQIDGFITLMVMGVGYMIVPRMRNILLPHKKLAYLSYLLVLTGIVFTVVDFVMFNTVLIIAGLSIFAFVIFWTCRVRPKLLPNADFFILLSVSSFLIYKILEFLGHFSSSDPMMSHQIMLLFPIMMIFGIEYKTLPSFLGFIRPKNSILKISFILNFTAICIGLWSFGFSSYLVGALFNSILFLSSLLLSISLYVFGGFDNQELLQLFKGEKKARYDYTRFLTKVSFFFLLLGFLSGIFYWMWPNFAFYDLTIHFLAIGFVGFSIMLYLPLMLPPIINKSLRFSSFSKIPFYLLLSYLGMRVFGDLMIILNQKIPLIYEITGFSGWLVVISLSFFVIMIHRSMKNKRLDSDLDFI